MKSVTFWWTWIFSWKRWKPFRPISHRERSASYLPNDAKYFWFRWMNDQLLSHWNQPLFWGFVQCSEQHSLQVHFKFGIFWYIYSSHLVPCGVWRWVIHLSFAKQGNSTQNLQLEIVKFREKVKCAQRPRPAPLYYTPAFFKLLCA
jgi:hypothetical protein